VPVLGQAQVLEQLVDVQGATDELRGHLDVLGHCQVRDEVVELEHEPDVRAAVARQLPG
jgi:hypothetical protein